MNDRRADDARLKALEERTTRIEHAVAENTSLTKTVNTNTAAIVDAWNAMAGGLKVLVWLAKAAKYVTYALGFVAAAYAVLKGGSPPAPPVP